MAGLTPPTTDGLTFQLCDATSASQVDNIFAETINRLGGLDVLYHVAGSSGRKHGDGALHECTDAGWQTTIDANLKSAFLTNRAAVRQFLNQKSGGVILNMSSVLAFDPSPRFFDTVAYTASKGGIIAMSRQIAARYAADTIRVNVLAPGLIDTPMAERAVNDPAIRAFLESKQPLGPGPANRKIAPTPRCFFAATRRVYHRCCAAIDGGWSVSDSIG